MLLNKERHYNATKLEVIDIIVAYEMDFCLGNVTKYLLRCRTKGDLLDNINKAIDYLELIVDNNMVPNIVYNTDIGISVVTDGRRLPTEVFKAVNLIFYSLKYETFSARIKAFRKALVILKCLVK